jgi:hypothetical protein
MPKNCPTLKSRHGDRALIPAREAKEVRDHGRETIVPDEAALAETDRGALNKADDPVDPVVLAG